MLVHAREKSLSPDISEEYLFHNQPPSVAGKGKVDSTAVSRVSDNIGLPLSMGGIPLPVSIAFQVRVAI
jgi:hypothetical protein